MPTSTLDRSATGIDLVADFLDAEFHGARPIEVIRRAVMTARRDLSGEVPPEALAEFTHRLARQRLIDLSQQATDETPLPGPSSCVRRSQ